ncbi:Dehydrogenase/reductase SDR family member 11 [Chionoecetes opilio]|uniref:Dehydrogenase/reductase SDR family member 11 n=1 Tax=Chionoecetes opilio TaxID=41210 RepID=A0A8J4YFQ2_CHIOP|nr:Dehydrogenase/reductase SDR family member 11 [Chionoecetes opilio]
MYTSDWAVVSHLEGGHLATLDLPSSDERTPRFTAWTSWMERWSGRVALVTGASAGIGASVARRLVAEGMRVVGAARSVERVQALADELKGQPGTLIPIKCDITKDDQVVSMFARIKRELGGVDVCVNNAGIAVFKDLLEGSPEEWRRMLDLNVVALCLCTREAVASMRERGVDDGHVIHLNRWVLGLPGCLAGWLAAWLADCLPAWLPGWLTAYLPGCLAG